MILSVAEVAQLLKCDEDVVAERIRSGDLPGLKYGRSWVIPKQALEQRLNELALQACRLAAKTAPAAPRSEPAERGARRRAPPPLPAYRPITE